MSCDLSDPHIPEAYEQIMAGKPTNWMILGYHDSRDTISLYSSGPGGTEELQKHLSDEVLYVFVRILNHRFVLVSYVPETVSGVRRARALVHGRTVASLLKDFEIQISASKLEDLTEEHLKTRLKPRDNNQAAGQGAPGVPLRTKKTKGPKDAAPPDAAAGRGGFSPSDGEPPSASDESPRASPGTRASPTAGTPEAALMEPTSPVVPARTRVTGVTSSAEPSPRTPAEPGPVPGNAEEAATGDHGGRDEPPDSADETANEAAAAQEAMLKAAAAEAAKQKKAAAAEAAKKKEDADKRAAEAARARRNENLRREASRGDQAGDQKGWICVQLENTFWRRRWFELRGKTLHFFKDPNDHDPVYAIELGPQVASLEDAHSETLMPHSFKMVHKTKGQVYFYSDDLQAKEHAMGAIRKAAA